MTDHISKLLNGVPEALFLLDKNRRIVLANSAAQAMFGSSHLGSDFVQVMRHPDCLQAIALVLSGEAREERIFAADIGGEGNFQVVVTNLGDEMPNDARAMVSVKDISERRVAEQMRSDFVANVSHELRSPLTAITGFIETLRTSARGESKAQERFLALMDVETQRMVRLIADLLSLSKVQSKKRVRPDGKVNVSNIIQGVAATLSDLANSEGKTINLELPEHSSDVIGSTDELTQVFQNLLENAVKYSRRDTAIGVRMFSNPTPAGFNGPALVIEVSDESEGIGQEHIFRLTERFYRVDNHRSRNKGGTGLGLAIVKHIINRHRGRLLIRSEIGKGSVFSVLLPIEKT